MAKLKLTEKSLAMIPAASTHAGSCPGGACDCPLQTYHCDTELVGFGVVVGRTGIKTFIARAWVNRKKRRVKIGIAGAPRADGHTWTVALARLEARQLLARMSCGDDPNAGKRTTSAPPPSTGPTLREGLELHLTNMRAGRNRRRRVCSPRSIHKMETEIPRYLADWLDRSRVDLTALEPEGVRPHRARHPARSHRARPGSTMAHSPAGTQR